MLSIEKIMENQLIVSTVLLVLGGIITVIFTKISNKTAVLRFYIETNKIGVSADDEIFGSVRSTWQGHEVRNLYLCNIEIENSTSKDFEGLKLKVYSGTDTFLLNQRTELVDTPYTIPWEEDYGRKIQIPEGEKATDAQIYEYHHNREYNVLVFNRGQKLRLSYLCTNPNDDGVPAVFLSTQNKSIKLKRGNTPHVVINPIFGVPVPTAITRALILSILVIVISGMWIDNIWMASSICMFVGLTGQILGAIWYRVETLIKNVVSG